MLNFTLTVNQDSSNLNICNVYTVQSKTCISVYHCVPSETDEVDVFYVDYSTTEFVPLDSIIVDVPPDFEQFPRQAWKFTLTGVKPVSVDDVSFQVKGHVKCKPVLVAIILTIMVMCHI